MHKGALVKHRKNFLLLDDVMKVRILLLDVHVLHGSLPLYGNGVLRTGNEDDVSEIN